MEQMLRGWLEWALSKGAVSISSKCGLNSCSHSQNCPGPREGYTAQQAHSWWPEPSSPQGTGRQLKFCVSETVFGVQSGLVYLSRERENTQFSALISEKCLSKEPQPADFLVEWRGLGTFLHGLL